MDDVTERARALYDKYRFGDIRLGAEKVRSRREDPSFVRHRVRRGLLDGRVP